MRNRNDGPTPFNMDGNPAMNTRNLKLPGGILSLAMLILGGWSGLVVAVDPTVTRTDIEVYSGALDGTLPPVREMITRFQQDFQLLQRHQGPGGGAQRWSERQAFFGR